MANSTIAPHPRELESAPPQLPVQGLKVHMLGICGTAMAALAGLLKSMGARVTGSDQNVYPPMSTVLEQLGIPVRSGFKPENIPVDTQWAIVGNVISRSNPEAQALLNSQIPFCSLPQALGALAIGARHSVVVSGTHGKTTTTSMATWIASELGLNPGFMIGGVAKNFPNSFAESKGDFFVIEGDEYDTAFFDKGPKFLHYRPKTVIINAVEFDHADIYTDLEHVKKSFISLLEKVPNDGLIVANGHENTVADVIQRSGVFNRNVRVVLFLDPSRPLADTWKTTIDKVSVIYQLAELKLSPNGIEFGTERYSPTAFISALGNKSATRPEFLVNVQIPVMGRYNAMNALAAMAVWTELGFKTDDIAKALQSFKGVKRRQELLGRPRDIAVIEDFAHHPTAVAGTLDSLRQHFPKARIHSVFEFRSATARRDVFTEEYLEAFQKADNNYFPPAFNQDSIPIDQRFHVDRFVRSLNERKKGSARLFPGVDAIVEALDHNARPGDVIVIMSNGGFDGIYQKLMTRLNQSAQPSSTA